MTKETKGEKINRLVSEIEAAVRREAEIAVEVHHLTELLKSSSDKVKDLKGQLAAETSTMRKSKLVDAAMQTKLV